MEKPTVFVAILAKQKGATLDYYLETLGNWDYPKDRMIIYIRTNNNTDNTADILRDWIFREGHQYRSVISDFSDIGIDLERYGVHEWNAIRFSVLAAIRQESIRAAIESGADFYFVSDVDNYLLPHTLSAMVEANQPVIAPMLHYAPALGENQRLYSNYHSTVNEFGYFQEDDLYGRYWARQIRGLIEVDLVHCTYLIRKDVLPLCQYIDGSEDYEYVIFSKNLRNQNIPQMLDNRQIYGCLTLEEDTEACRLKMQELA